MPGGTIDRPRRMCRRTRLVRRRLLRTGVSRTRVRRAGTRVRRTRVRRDRTWVSRARMRRDRTWVSRTRMRRDRTWASRTRMRRAGMRREGRTRMRGRGMRRERRTMTTTREATARMSATGMEATAATTWNMHRRRRMECRRCRMECRRRRMERRRRRMERRRRSRMEYRRGSRMECGCSASASEVSSCLSSRRRDGGERYGRQCGYCDEESFFHFVLQNQPSGCDVPRLDNNFCSVIGGRSLQCDSV